MRYQCSFGWSGLVQTNSLVNLVISASVARLRGYLAPTAVALANVTTEPRARVCGRPAATLEIKNIFAAPGERMELRKSTADGARFRAASMAAEGKTLSERDNVTAKEAASAPRDPSTTGCARDNWRTPIANPRGKVEHRSRYSVAGAYLFAGNTRKSRHRLRRS